MLGPEHPDTLASIANLASMRQGQHRWREAEELHRQVADARKRVLGLEHPHTLYSMVRLASVYYRKQGREEEADRLEEEVMEIGRNVAAELRS